jgi:hypothetical protein
MHRAPARTSFEMIEAHSGGYTHRLALRVDKLEQVLRGFIVLGLGIGHGYNIGDLPCVRGEGQVEEERQ